IDTAVTGKLSVDTADMAGRQVNVLLNDTLVGTFAGGGVYEYTDLGHTDKLELAGVPEPSTLTLLVVGGGVGLLLWRLMRKK
ncbi:MAG: PEP-CTERM sorting domain-containing protein, partial [Pirellulales bacterium]|nr:PEP-CTERM sorting domain-containing protein [Pirellulales bacterium]